MPAIETTPALVEKVYGELSSKLQVIRQRLGSSFAGITVTHHFYGQHDVLNGRQTGQQLKRLENKSDEFCSDFCARFFVKRRDFMITKENLTASRRIETRQQA